MLGAGRLGLGVSNPRSDLTLVSPVFQKHGSVRSRPCGRRPSVGSQRSLSESGVSNPRSDLTLPARRPSRERSVGSQRSLSEPGVSNPRSDLTLPARRPSRGRSVGSQRSLSEPGLSNPRSDPTLPARRPTEPWECQIRGRIRHSGHVPRALKSDTPGTSRAR